MNFNRSSLQKLLALPDEELAKVIKEIAEEAGIDPSSFSVESTDIAKLRAMLSLASNEEIARLLQQFGGK